VNLLKKMLIKRRLICKMKKKISKKVDDINRKSVKPLKVRFCPECKSTDVAFVFRMKNIFGLLPRVECYKCGNNGVEFPLLVVKAEDLNKMKKKVKKVKNVGRKK
jgi:hypothetical protein